MEAVAHAIAAVAATVTVVVTTTTTVTITTMITALKIVKSPRFALFQRVLPTTGKATIQCL